MPKTITLYDDHLSGRDIDAHISYLLTGHDFLDNVDSSELRKWLNGEITLGEGDKSAVEAAKDEITDTDDLDTLETMADNLGYWSEVLSELDLEDTLDTLTDSDLEEALCKIRGKICALLDGEGEARAFCDEFSVDYAIEFDPNDPNADEYEELANWLDLKEQAESYCGGRFRDCQLINEGKFVDYCQEYASDIGAILRDAEWPTNHIDWEAAADELKSDYTEIEVDGNTFLVRS